MKDTKWIQLGIITAIWIIGTIGICFTVNIPASSTKSLEVVKILFISLSAYGVVAATFISGYSSLESMKSTQNQVNFMRIENSFKYIERWESPSIKEARDFTRELKSQSNTISNEEITQRLDADMNLKRSVITILNFWQDMYLAIINNRVAEDILRRAFAQIYRDFYRVFAHYIEHTLDEDPQGRDDLLQLHRKWI